MGVLKIRKKIIIISLIIILVLLIGICLFNFSIFEQNNEINLGNATFIAPPSYYKANEVNDAGDMGFTNGSNSIYLTQIDGNLERAINDYMNYRSSNNYSVEITNFTLDNQKIYKTSVSGDKSVNYWFEINGTVYSIYFWDDNPKMDITALSSITSAKLSN